MRLYEETKDAGSVCRRCGISRPTLRKWWNRYQATGIEGLQSHSSLHHSPNAKVGNKEEQLILKLRRTKNLGARRLQSELIRLHGLSLTIATIHIVLHKNHVKPVICIRKKSDFIRYERPISGVTSNGYQ